MQVCYLPENSIDLESYGCLQQLVAVGLDQIIDSWIG